MPISVFDALISLEQERYRAVILHAAPEKSPSMSQFCQKVCKQTNGKTMGNIWIYWNFLSSLQILARI